VNRHVIPAVALAAAALAGAASLAGCAPGRHEPPYADPFPATLAATGPTTAPVGQNEPMIPATATAPDYLNGPNPTEDTLSGTLPQVASVAADAVSIPWDPVGRAGSDGALTVNVDDGGCISKPFGYTAVTYQNSVIIGIYSTNLLPSGEACAGVGHLATYRIALPPADAKLPLLHASYR
jgi:hypothetical protein